LLTHFASRRHPRQHNAFLIPLPIQVLRNLDGASITPSTFLHCDPLQATQSPPTVQTPDQKMASWDSQTSPLIKLESSPAESFMSTPEDIYPSLFAPSSPSASTTMNPLEILTPKSFTDESMADVSLAPTLAGGLPPASSTTPTTAEKKPAKKRKSWGQVLPEPKTNLPPR
jgi:hypothetical protein